eukprot:CCRYP_020715-RA/>CCRYP_020715-RA protein AED:0.33 eAED:0.33 QI:0/0.66/0.5/1/0.66/0.5/4/413/753
MASLSSLVGLRSKVEYFPVGFDEATVANASSAARRDEERCISIGMVVGCGDVDAGVAIFTLAHELSHPTDQMPPQTISAQSSRWIHRHRVTGITLSILISSEQTASAKRRIFFPPDSPPIPRDSNSCMLYIAESTIPHAGLGIFAGVDFVEGELIGHDNWGDPAFATVDINWNNAEPDGRRVSKARHDYHWPLTNYGWESSSLGIIEEEGVVTSMYATGFGAVPNCHFSLINIEEHEVRYDLAGLSRYNSPGSGAITPFINRTTTAIKDIKAGSEFFVSYGSSWFKNRPDYDTVPVKGSYIEAEDFLEKYGLFLLGNPQNTNGWKFNLFINDMILKEEAQKDLWDIIKSFPYVSRARQALPATSEDVMRAIHRGIGAVEVENSMRSLEYLKEHGRCVDNIVPGNSTIPHAGRGAFATRFIPRGSLVAPAPLVHITDKSALIMYNETRDRNGKLIKNEKEILTTQIIRNYMFGHPNSSVVLFPYSHHVAYINHHSTEFNARLQWAKNFSFHNEDWLYKDVTFLDQQWRAGLMLEFIATRDIKEGEEILIDYGKDWQNAWDTHVKQWTQVDPEKDFNNYTHLTKFSAMNAAKAIYRRAEFYKSDNAPIKTVAEQETDPYPRNVVFKCRVDVDIGIGNYTYAPETTPVYKRKWITKDLNVGHKKSRRCNVIERLDASSDYYGYDDHPFMYTVEISNVRKNQGKRENHVITGVPFRAIDIVDEKYSSDMFLKNAFRHEMGLPDGLWPKAWMNLVSND